VRLDHLLSKERLAGGFAFRSRGPRPGDAGSGCSLGRRHWLVLPGVAGASSTRSPEGLCRIGAVVARWWGDEHPVEVLREQPFTTLVGGDRPEGRARPAGVGWGCCLGARHDLLPPVWWWGCGLVVG
jgi:hypothetical protein